ncbi:MAG: carboxylating nicotinate-nucleotide diphosphorylase, partial [Epsilonproteobacteria bacterium]|nr:carboxylating nicotinate-nucleotide diphosphorylase [Campylobacterota bacterium]
MDIEEFLKEAIREDIGRGDLFSRVFNSKKIEAFIKAKSDGVLAGRLYLDKLAKLYELDFKWNFDDSCEFKKGDILVEIKGDSNILLSLERVILNILLHASSIATKTKQYVDELKGFNTILLDTRKTRPLLRNFEKYAVRCGGGVNHRMGLDDALMLKDTHLKSIDNLEEFMKNVRKKIPFTSKVEIECESFEDAKRAFRVGADIVMC